MPDRVLFSAIGLRDPTHKNYDGSLLHIIRHYRPHTAVLFFTKETAELHRADNRYFEMIQRVDPGIILRPVIREDLINAHFFEIYDKIFEEQLKSLHAEFPDDSLLVNISSGTPQMEASLYMLSAVLPFPITIVQVSRPEENSDHREHSFDIEVEWSNLKDNHDAEGGEKNRCGEVETENIRRKIQIENIQNQIESYSYAAARRLCDGVEELISPKAVALLDAAVLRQGLRSAEALAAFKKAGVCDNDLAGCFPVQTVGIRELFEYIADLDIKLKKGSLMDFARGISPLLTDLFGRYLKTVYNVDAAQWCTRDLNGVMKLRRTKIESGNAPLLKHLDNRYPKEFADAPLSALPLCHIIDYYSNQKGGDPGELSAIGELRKFESSVRNLAAHEIVGLTPERIKKDSDMSPKEVSDKLHRLFERVSGTKKKDIWGCIDAMNRLLCAELKR